MPTIDVRPAMTLEEVASQIEEAMSYSVDHYTRVCDVVLGQWLMVCRSIDVDALLALADEMDRDGRVQRERQKACEHWFIDGLDVMEYARRIREALGVDA